MIQRQLQQHQSKAFRRNPMFERNLAMRIFMGVMLAFVVAEYFALGLVLDKILVEVGTYDLAISVFNSVLPYIFAGDFLIKFFFKSNQSMQIAPYLTLPINKNTLFNFLLRKEFVSLWNMYLLPLVIPFAFKAVLPYFGFTATLAYIVAFWLLCIASSMLVTLVNNLLSKSWWAFLLAGIIVAAPYFLFFVCKFNTGDYSFHFGEALLNFNWIAYLSVLLCIMLLWVTNRLLMRQGLYRELQGEKVEKISSFSSLSFLDRFGAVGDFINLEIKMIMRAPRIKKQMLMSPAIIIGLYLYMLYVPGNTFMEGNKSIFFLYGIMSLGLAGIIMGQYIFVAESAHFDGLAARPLSLFDMLRGKYFLYCAYSVIITLILLLPAFQGKISAFLLISMLPYVTGPVYFIIFQNTVYNKTHFDLFDKGMMNWRGQSGNMIAFSMMTMFVPVIIILILNEYFNETATCWFMLISGLAFTLTSQLWLSWIYKRFLKRKYKNMEGFRSK
ncbi:MAG: DUF5687 family protein [Tannerella sp.]|jgi:hypothetical protein|nr:DUF5687 family protein [Tannerella sp.]